MKKTIRASAKSASPALSAKGKLESRLAELGLQCTDAKGVFARGNYISVRLDFIDPNNDWERSSVPIDYDKAFSNFEELHEQWSEYKTVGGVADAIIDEIYNAVGNDWDITYSAGGWGLFWFHIIVRMRYNGYQC